MLKRWHAFFVWFVGTLIAIAVIGENMYLGVALAIASGIVFGIFNFLVFRNYERRMTKDE